MPDSIARRRRGTADQAPAVLTAASQIYSSVNAMASRTLNRPDASEDELWAFYDALGEYAGFVDWVKNAASRVRLGAAEIVAGADEPEILKEGDAAQLMEEFYGGPSGYAAFWQAMIPQLLVPGEGWIVAERFDRETPLLLANWSVQSIDSFKQQRAGSGVINKVQVAEGDWRELMPDSLPCRVWYPDPRRPWLARSPARAALPTMRRLDLIDKRIVAELLSRVIMNGILWMPQEIQLPQSEAYKDQADPFWAEFIDIGTRNISTPGSALAAFPYPVKVPGNMIEQIRHMKLSEPLDEQLLNERTLELSRLAKQLPLSSERQQGMGSANHWCLSDDTEIYSQDRGWITQDTLAPGDVVMTLNHETGLSEWQPVLDLYRADVVDEPMIHLKNSAHSSISTAAHKWPIVKTGKHGGTPRRWTTSGEGFAWADRVPVAARLSRFPEIPKYDDQFVRLVAAYMSDGTKLSPPDAFPTARIAKFDEREISDLRAVLRHLFGGEFTENAHPTRTRDGLAFRLPKGPASTLFAVTGEHRAPTREFIDSLTESQAHLFLAALIEIGDGVTKGSSRTFFQVEPVRLDAIERVAILAGYGVIRGVREKSNGFSDRPLHWITVTNRRVLSPRDCVRQEVSYTGTIWCPVTANHTWLARRDGRMFYTGNTGWLVNEDDVKISIAPLCEIAFESLTRGYLYPLLAAARKPIIGPNGGRLVVWGDYSELTSPPDKQASTLAAYDRGEASGAALRRESGLDESDKPEPTEQAEMIWLKAARDGSSPAQPMAIEKLTGEALPVETPAAPAVVGPTPDPVSAELPGAAGPPSSSTPNESPLPSPSMTASAVDARFSEIARRVNGRA